MVVPLHPVPRREAVPENPEALVEVDVEQLDAEVAGVDPGGVVLTEVQGFGESVHRDHGLGCGVGHPCTLGGRGLRLGFLGQTQHHLAEDVALDLAGAGVDRAGTGVVERAEP